MVSSHLAAQWARRRGHSVRVMTLSADTRVGADGWAEFVRAAGRQLRLPQHSIRKTEKIEDWETRIRHKGFPYRRSQHAINFYYLKQCTFRTFMQECKKHWRDRIMFVDGVRRAESSERSSRAEHTRSGCEVHVNPILYWQDEHVDVYRHTHEMPNNPFYDLIGNSGDCLCNWHTQYSVDLLRSYARDAGRIIEPLHYACRETFGYGYGEEPRNGTFAEGAGVQMSLFDVLPGIDETPNLCSGCRKPKATNAARDDVLIQRMEW